MNVGYPQYSQPLLGVPYLQTAVQKTGSTISRIAMFLLGLAIVGIVVFIAYNLIRSSRGQSTVSLLPSERDFAAAPIDGTKGSTITAAELPTNDTTSYGMQFWMYIKDWDYGFGREKGVVLRSDPANKSIMNPNITLHPTDNSLNVSVSLYSSGAAGAETPSPSNSTSSNGDTFTCTVENVPLQSWFAVSVTVFQRNLDIYINGRLVKSCVLPGIPRLAVGDVVVGANQGFSGSICNLKYHNKMLHPSDAMGFFNAGTACGSSKSTGSTDTGGSSITLFGYTFTFSVKDKKGQEVRSYSF